MDMKKKQEILSTVLLVFFAAVFIVSAGLLVNYFITSWIEQKKFDELADLVEQNRQNTSNPGVTLPVVTIPAPTPDPADETTDNTDTSSPTESNTVLPEYASLYLENPDFIGWLTVPGTKIDYPVMQTPNDKDYYLRRNFYGEHSTAGCIYVREECDVQRPSDNLTIYGHNMKNGTMFADLLNYLEKSFWEEHKTFNFDTLTERHTYEIIAVFKTSANTGKGFPYHQFVDAKDQADFDNFVSTCKKMAFYDTGLTAEYGDKLICLSTCEYTLSNGRFVVLAKRIS